MSGLTVGYVAGIIALCMVVIQVLISNLIPVILVGCLEKEHTAATWSVVGRGLQSSSWPSILRTDMFNSKNVDRKVKLLTSAKWIVTALIVISSIVTPFGLYDTIELSSFQTEVTFTYAKDDGPFGNGTIRSSYMGFTRVCNPVDLETYVSDHESNATIFFCPETEAYQVNNLNTQYVGPYNLRLNSTLDARIPASVAERFQSGVADQPTIASFFDVEYRNTLTTNFFGYNDNQTTARRFYQSILNLSTGDSTSIIEGSIVDPNIPRIGFRNHTTPSPIEAPLGAEWEEDLLFFQPMTQCVDLNISVEFTVNINGTGVFNIPITGNQTLVDRGGFAQLNVHGSQRTSFTQNQTDPQLWDRAYLAGYLFNGLLMEFFNVSNAITGSRTKIPIFVTSQIGNRYPISNGDQTQPQIRPNAINTADFSSPLMSLLLDDKYVNSTLCPGRSLNCTYSNPYNLTFSNFTSIREACSLSDFLAPDHSIEENQASIDRLGINCGLLYGPAYTIDAQWYGSPMYSCASVVEASVKRVRFRWNITDLEPRLAGLQVVSITDDTHAYQEAPPTWVVENLRKYNLSSLEAQPIWGIMSGGFEQQEAQNLLSLQEQKFSTISSNRLLLPGHINYNPDLTPHFNYENLPAADFHMIALQNTYAINEESVISKYTGSGDANLAQKWKELSQNISTVPDIANRIWLDQIANGLVGTKGQLPKPNLPPNLSPAAISQPKDRPAQSQVKVPVYLPRHVIRFQWAFGIPLALTVLFLFIIIFLSLYAAIRRHVRPSTMRYYLNSTSTGRLLTADSYQKPGLSRTAPRQAWSSYAGWRTIQLNPKTDRVFVMHDQEKQIRVSGFVGGPRYSRTVTIRRHPSEMFFDYQGELYS